MKYVLIYRWGKSNERIYATTDYYEIDKVINFIYERFNFLPLRIEVKDETPSGENEFGEEKGK